MGNSGQRKFLEPLRRLADSDDALIREHAEWAIGRLLYVGASEGRESPA
jgi:epoxyqueuosine reductase QueG